MALLVLLPLQPARPLMILRLLFLVIRLLPHEWPAVGLSFHLVSRLSTGMPLPGVTEFMLLRLERSSNLGWVLGGIMIPLA